MKAINDIKMEMHHMKMVMNFIEKETNGNEFSVKDLHEKHGGYFISGALMKALERRNLVEVVGTRPSSFKTDILIRNKWVEVKVPCTVNVYKQIHDYEWYKNVMLKTLIDTVTNV